MGTGGDCDSIKGLPGKLQAINLFLKPAKPEEISLPGLTITLQ